MPTLTPEWDGYVGAGTGPWATLMTATSGKTFNYNDEYAAGAIKVTANSDNTLHQKFEVFLEFSTANTTVESATLKIYLQNVTSGMQIRGVRGTWSNNTDNNYNDFAINDDYFTATTVTNGWNTITLNSDAITQLSSLGSLFKIFLVEEFVHESAGDSNSQPSANYEKSADFYFSEHVMPIRGIPFMYKSGDNIMSFNFELRAPFLLYYFPAIKWIGQLNAIAFVDAGVTWNKTDPMPKISNSNHWINREDGGSEQGWVMSYGWGPRFILFGLPFQINYAWQFNPITKQKSSKRYEFTIGIDL